LVSQTELNGKFEERRIGESCDGDGWEQKSRRSQHMLLKVNLD